MILPTDVSKYPGHIWQTETGYRIGFTNTVAKRETRRFPSYEQAFTYLQNRSKDEHYVRVKNLICRNDHHLEMKLAGGTVMLFDECDLILAQSRVWHRNNKGYVQCSPCLSLPSTLFHVCLMGTNAPEGYEYVHLNHNGQDNRRCNISIARKSRKKSTLLTVV